jgi:hypothetical protein
MAAEAGLREALDLTDILGGDYETAQLPARVARRQTVAQVPADPIPR